MDNPLGSFTGTVELKQNSIARLEVPTSAVPDWSARAFNTMAIHENYELQRTIRWPRFKELEVWIEPVENDPNLTPAMRDRAFEAFEVWEDAVDGLITFRYVSNRQDADIALVWDPDDPDVAEVQWTPTSRHKIEDS